MNTTPLVYGIENSPEFYAQVQLSKDIPSVCAEKLITGEVDLGLVPVAIIPKLKSAEIITDYCIGAEGKVKSVSLFSEVPLSEIEYIYLDYQSRTSVALCKILCKEFWKISPTFLPAEPGYEDKINKRTAAVIIGDRTFHLPKPYNFEFDLADEWQKMTGLPFVFAAWVTNKKLPEAFISNFNSTLKFGLQHLDNAIEQSKVKSISNAALKEYLTTFIKFDLTENKKKGLNLFLSKLDKFQKNF